MASPSHQGSHRRTGSSRQPPPHHGTARRWLLLLSACALAMLTAAVTPSCTLDSMGTNLDAGAGGTGGASGGECTEDGQCPGATDDCKRPNCVGGECGTYNELTGSACSMDGGQYCNGLGACVQCADDEHCPGARAICDTTVWQCIDATCVDGVQNAGETDLDCGGPCPGCANGQQCVNRDDCASGYCLSGTCRPCSDHPQCDTGYCNPVTEECESAKLDGEACTDPIECASGYCVNGVCCDGACDGLCVSCLQADTGGTDGACAAVTAGTDPGNECDVAGNCGATECNGNTTTPACDFPASGTECAPASCSDGTGQQTNQDTCDGAGTCTDNGTTSCNGLRCDGSACRTSCSDHSHCLTAYWCDTDSACKADKGNGQSCTDPDECTSGHCTDGYCCNEACSGSCYNDCSSNPGTCENSCSCDQQYGLVANNYELCAESAASCEFFTSRTSSFTCNWQCAQAGGQCLDAWNDGADHCTHAGGSNCNAGLNGQICRCSR